MLFMQEINQLDLSVQIREERLQREKRVDTVEKWGEGIDMHGVLAPSIGARISMQ